MAELEFEPKQSGMKSLLLTIILIPEIYFLNAYYMSYVLDAGHTDINKGDKVPHEASVGTEVPRE